MRTYTVDDLRALSSSELVAVYNEASGKTTKKFADKETGLRQTMKALGMEIVASPKKEKKAKEPKPAKEKKEGSKRTVGFNFVGKGPKKDPKPNGKRAKILALISRANGASVEEIAEHTANPRGAVAALAYSHGYSFQQSESGRIRLA